MKEDWYRSVYSPSAAKTYETSLFNLISTEVGYIGGPDIVKLFVKKIVELNNKYYLRDEFVRPGQMRWLALKAGQKYSKSKKLSDMQLIPVTLTLINPEDIEDRIKNVVVHHYTVDVFMIYFPVLEMPYVSCIKYAY